MGTSDPYDLQRFVDAQQGVIAVALSELAAGSKRSHWMWFAFPQLAELGRSQTAKYFGLGSIGEAEAYLAHPILGPRLRESAKSLVPWTGRRSAEQIFGPVDAMKLRSSMSLFDSVEPDSIFGQVLVNFFDGKRDELTLALLEPRR